MAQVAPLNLFLEKQVALQITCMHNLSYQFFKFQNAFASYIMWNNDSDRCLPLIRPCSGVGRSPGAN